MVASGGAEGRVVMSGARERRRAKLSDAQHLWRLNNTRDRNGAVAAAELIQGVLHSFDDLPDNALSRSSSSLLAASSFSSHVMLSSAMRLSFS